jgi:preprotein translocase subunit SecB
MVRLSPLKLNNYFIEELHVVVRPLKLEKPTPLPELLPEDLDVMIEHFEGENAPGHFLCHLQIKLKETGKLIPYYFLVRLIGAFELDTQGLNRQQCDTHIQFSMPSLLWAVAREILKDQMAKGPYPPVMLPVVTFLPEKVEGTAKLKG